MSRNAESALHVAEQLRKSGDEITLLNVLEEPPGYVTTYSPPDFRKETEAPYVAKLTALADEVPGGIPVLLHGHPAARILKYAKRAIQIASSSDRIGGECRITFSVQPQQSFCVPQIRQFKFCGKPQTGKLGSDFPVIPQQRRPKIWNVTKAVLSAKCMEG